ncbi:MAG: Ig-like domain-containing protein, partial [Sediminibacterium sp.]
MVIILALATSFFANAQSNPGAILGSQCITAGATPTAFTSIRNADVSGGLIITWEKSVDLAFTVPVPIGGANSQTYTEGAVLTTTYYRRVVNSAPVSYSNIITVTVVGAVANPTFTPQVPPFPIICQQITSFPINYTTTGTPDRYSIIWDATAAAEGFVDVVDVVLAATPGNFTVNVPAGAAASVYNGTLIAINTANGCTVSNASSVLINPLPTITGTLSACIGAATQLTGSGTAAAVNPWTSSNAGVATVDNTGLVTSVSAGTTIITYTNNNGCQQTATVTINALPIITGTLSACVNATTQLSGSGTAAAVNPWVSSNTGVATVDNTGLVTSVSAGTTIITYTNNNGCQQTATVAINALPIITGPLSACVNATTQLSGSGTAAAVNPWVSSNTGVATVDNTGLVSGVSAGTSVITYTNNNGCQQTATVTINALPTIGGSLNVCIGLTTQLTGSGTAAAVNPWVSSNTGVATVDNTELVTSVAVGTSIITYTDNIGCPQTATVTINALPVITGTLSACVNATTQLSGSGTAATVNPWGSSNTGVATVDNTGLVAAVSAGTSVITYTNNNGCQQTATVTINSLPTVAITSPTLICAPGVIDLTATNIITGSTGGLTYTQWNNALATSSLTNASAITSSGVYYIKGTIAATGCSVTQPVTATINSLPTVAITNPAAVCAPGVIDLTLSNITSLGSTANLSYTQWNNALATSSLTNASAITSSGVYYIKGTIA